MNTYQIWFRIFVSVVSVTSLWIAPARAAEMLVSDPYSGCKVFIDSGERAGTSVIWNGACTADKYANGDGILYWVAGKSYDRVFYSAHFSKRGLVMQNGHISKNIPEDVMTVAFNNDNKCRSVNAVVKGDVDVGLGVLDVLLNSVVSLYKAACPEEWEKPGSFGIKMTHEAIQGKIDGYIDHRTGERHFGESFEGNRRGADNGAEDKRLMLLEQNARQVATQNYAAQQRQQQQQAQNEANMRLQAFQQKYGAIGWVQWKNLAANPFAEEGKVYLFNAEFQRMITPTSAIFQNMVVSDLPRNAFTTPTKVMLAGKVLGTTNIKNQFGGEVSVPQVRYLGHIACRDPDCGGYFNGNLR